MTLTTASVSSTNKLQHVNYIQYRLDSHHMATYSSLSAVYNCIVTFCCNQGAATRSVANEASGRLGLGGLWEAGPRRPRKAKFWLAIAKSWLQLELIWCQFAFIVQTAWNLFSWLRKIIKIVATRCQILRLKCTKFNFGWDSAPNPAGGAYSAPPDTLAGFEGAYF